MSQAKHSLPWQYATMWIAFGERGKKAIMRGSPRFVKFVSLFLEFVFVLNVLELNLYLLPYLCVDRLQGSREPQND